MTTSNKLTIYARIFLINVMLSPDGSPPKMSNEARVYIPRRDVADDDSDSDDDDDVTGSHSGSLQLLLVVL